MKTKWIMIIGMLLFSLAACEKDDEPSLEIIPDELVGTWLHTESDGEDLVIIEKKTDISGHFEWYWNVQLEEVEEQATLLAVKASFVIKAHQIIATVMQCGSQFVEFEEEQVLEEIAWYTREDEEWDWFDFDEDIYIYFELKNGQLIIKEDGNNDGDFDDEYEQTVFIKQP